MARTAPVPNIPPIPGMCPSVAVMGGGGDGGGGSGRGSAGGDGGAGAGASDGGEGATPDQRGAQSGSGACGGGGGCPGNHGGRGGGSASKGDPVDVVTGRVFTVPAIDLALLGPLPLELARAYSSGASATFIDLLDCVDACYPTGSGHIIMDDLSTHTTDEVLEWFEEHPRWKVHFTPKHASWLNQIECAFSELQRRALDGAPRRLAREGRDAVRAADRAGGQDVDAARTVGARRRSP